MDRPSDHVAGVTLLELLAVLAIAAVTVSVGAPPLGDWLAERRLRATLELLQTDLQRARYEAVVRNQPVVVCASADGTQCSAGGWGRGWLVFVNADDDHPARLGGADTLIAVHRADPLVHVVGNRDAFSFRGDLRRATNGSLMACDRRAHHPVAARALIVSFTGRARLAPRGSEPASLACP